MLQILSLGLLKSSIILFYRRIFCTGRKDFFEWVTKLVMLLVLILTAVFFCLEVFKCGIKWEANWSAIYAFNHECQNIFIILVSYAGTDCLTGLLILVLPTVKVSLFFAADTVFVLTSFPRSTTCRQTSGGRLDW